jgi:ketosteroid isomerase-like protein
LKCPTCGKENAEGNVFCNWCGTKLAGSTQSQSASQSPQNQPVSNVEDEVRNVIVKRFDGIKNKDEKTVTALLDGSYSKFDDWPPYQIQQCAQALQNEFTAFKVLSNYTYELKDFKATVLGEVALATFTVHYQANMRNQQFDVTSRATAVLKKQDSTWKLVHEHLSRFPTERQPDQQRQFGRRRFPF